MKRVFSGIFLMFLLLSISVLPVLGQEMSRLDRVVKDGKITIGMNLTYPPVGFRSPSGEPDGYDVDLAKDLAKALGVEIEWFPVTNETRAAVLVSDKVDIVFSNYTRTPERAKVIDFTDPYVVTGMSMLARKKYQVKKVEDLVAKNLKVGVGKGTIGDIYLAEHFPKANKVVFDAMSDALLALKQDKVAAILEDLPWINAQAKKDPNLEATGGVLTIDVNGVALRRGQPQWRQWLNIWIDDVNRSGRNRAYYLKWFGNEPVKISPDY